MKITFIILIALNAFLCSSCCALCLGYSWITELHAKKQGINCKSAQNQINAVVTTITEALISSRQVDLTPLGVFSVIKSSKSNSYLQQISFKASKELSQQVNKDKNK